MLYCLSPSNGGLGSLEPFSFLDASDLQRTEQDLENHCYSSGPDVLFEGAPLLPIFQERQLSRKRIYTPSIARATW